MKICIFSVVTYWHGIKGGMEVHGKLLTEELVKRGHEVSVIATKHPDGKEFENIKGVNLYYLNNTVFGCRRKGWKRESLKKFLELNDNSNFEIICCQQPIISKNLAKIAKRKIIPLVIILEGHEWMMLLSKIREFFSHRKGVLQVMKAILIFPYYHFVWEWPLLKICDAIISVSDEVSRSLCRWFNLNGNKIYTVYNGVNINMFSPSSRQRNEIRKIYNCEFDRLLLFLSFATRQKGLHLLLHAFPEIMKKISNLKLMIVGDGEYSGEAMELVKKLNIDKYVIFARHVPHQDVASYINASDLFVFPTLRQEGLPFALVEAMSCQRPVIASRIGGIPSLIDDKVNGILVSPGYINELADKIIYLLENENIARSLGIKAREKVVRQFSVDNMVKETIKVFEAVRLDVKRKTNGRRINIELE